MFDIGWSEMVFIGIIAVLVIGPKDLPKTIATIGKYIRKARGFAREFQTGIDDLARDAELDDLKKSFQGDDFNIKKQVEDAVDPTGDFSKMFDDVKPNIVDDTPASDNSTENVDLPTENAISGSLEADSETTADTKVSS
ncbi:twin arginine-targeting protein translocase TatB [Alphaproteobacteria bacterium 46_93_T64]|nr:twin arginine-targeting protein translocase TatB [Alphaproteobacteria bacterium 46_93_T64]